jgi:hypothetical protein
MAVEEKGTGCFTESWFASGIELFEKIIRFWRSRSGPTAALTLQAIGSKTPHERAIEL